MHSTARRAFSAWGPLVGLLVALGAACAPPPVAPPPMVAPSPPPPKPEPPKPAPASAPVDPFAVKGPFRPAPLPSPVSQDVTRLVYTANNGPTRWRAVVTPPPPSCRPYLEKARAKPPTVACAKLAPSAEGAKDGAASLLLEALAVDEPLKRDERLRELAACKGLPAAEREALRALLAPPECGDAIVGPLAEHPEELAPLDKSLAHTIVGLWLAGKLARTVGPLPQMKPPFNKDALVKFTRGQLRDWFNGQGAAIDELAKLGATLEGQGRALAAVEAGIADMRFVDRVREVPMPPEWKRDPEIGAVYQQSLDQAMEPRKQRGRDAALVGLSDAASLGILHDARIARARGVLSKLFGGARVDALDGLLLPAARPLPASASWSQRLAAKLPLTFGERLLGAETARDEPWILAVCESGLPADVRRRASQKGFGGMSEAATERVVRARVELGRTYFRGVELDQVLEMADRDPARFASPEMKLYLALALALRHGPDTAATMMWASSPASLELRHTEALDALAAADGPFAGMAAFDAAWLRQLSPPEGATAEWFADVAARFRAAEKKLVAAPDKAAAAARATLAEDTAKTLR